MHDHEGHAGVHRSTNAITSFFIWPDMYAFIRKYVVSCHVCQQANKANRLPGGYSHPFDVPPTPGLEWGCDFLELPTTVRGNSV